MLALLITCAIAASLLVELGLMVARELMQDGQERLSLQRSEDERQMNGLFNRTSGAA